MDRKQFYQEIYDIVRVIPPGRVATYGQIATWPLDLKATSSFSNRIFCSGHAGAVRP